MTLRKGIKMKKTVLLLMLGAFLSASCAVNIEHKKEIRKNREHNNFRILNSAPVKYTVEYVISERNGKKTVGDSSDAITGIGLNSGWYQGGSLRIFVNGRSLTAPAKIERKGDTMVFTWDKAVLKMVFPEGSEKIYCHVSAPGAKQVKLGFLGMPGFLPKRKTEYKSYVSTSKINHSLNDGNYVSQGESWFMLYDLESNRRGIPVIILDPAEVKSGEASGGPKRLLVTAQFEMKKTDCRFVLMGVPSGHMDAETLYEDLKANGEKYLDALKKFQFK